jgi:hypothetical protein
VRERRVEERSVCVFCIGRISVLAAAPGDRITAAMTTATKDDVIADVGDAAEAFNADDGAPLHEIESLCMRCGENVIPHISTLFLFFVFCVL